MNRLEDVAQADWDRLAGDDGFYLSYDWLRFVQAEVKADPRHVLALDSGTLRGALSLYRLEGRPSLAYGEAHFRDLLGYPGTFLLAGAIRGYRSTLLVEEDDGAAEIITALVKASLEAAAADGCDGIVFPFLTTPALLRIASAVRIRAAFDVAEADITGIGDGLERYCEQLTHKVRNRILADRAKFTEAGWRVQVRSLDECWRDMARMLGNLEQKYGRSEADTARLVPTLANQARIMGSQSIIFTCEDDDGIAGMVLGYPWRSTLFMRAAGFDYERLRNAREYFNIGFYEPIEYSKNVGASRMHLGIASWEAKGYRGAVMRPLWSAVIGADGERDAAGLELAGTERARQALDDIEARGVRAESAEWTAIEHLATAAAPPA